MSHPYQAAASYASAYPPGTFFPYGTQQGAGAPAPTLAPAPAPPASSPSSYSPHAMTQAQSYSPHAMNQTHSQAQPPAQPTQVVPAPIANYGHFDANSQRFPYLNLFQPEVMAQFGTPPALLPPPPPLGFPPPIPFANLQSPQPVQPVQPVQSTQSTQSTEYRPNVPADPSPYSSQQNENGTDDDDAYDPRYPQGIIPQTAQSNATVDQSANLQAGQKQSQPDRERAKEPETLFHQLNASSKPKSANPFVPSTDSHLATTASSSSPAPFQRHYEHTSGPELRGLAKGALLSLDRHNIHYDDLVKEGIDQHVLASLYKELHIEISPRAALQPASQPASQPPPHPHSRPASRHVVRESSERKADQPPVTSSNLASAPGSAPSPAPAAPAPATAMATTTASVQPPAANAGLERKDRIAQLLAAKKARASPTSNATETGTAIASQGVKQDAPSNPPSVATKNTTPDAVSEHVDSGSNSVAKTASDDHVDGTGQIPPPLQRKATDGATDTAISSQVSSSIPGLFMTSDDPIATADPPLERKTAPNEEPAARTPSTSPSQKRRRSLDEAEQVPARVSKRQNTASEMDVDEGEVVARDSPSEKDVSETKGVAINSRTQLQRSQSASELPSLPKRPQSTESAPPNQGAPKAANPFGKSPVTGMTTAQIKERAELLKARFLRQRAERQKALQDGLPNLEAEVTKTRALLADRQNALSQVDERMRKLQDEISDLTRQKESISEEISQLEARLQDGISGQRQLSDELRKLGVEKNTAPSQASEGERQTELVPGAKESSPQVHAQPGQDSGGDRSDRPDQPEQSEQAEPQPQQPEQPEQPHHSQTNGTASYGHVNGIADHDSTVEDQPAADDDRQDASAGQDDGEDSDGSASMSDSGSEEGEYEPADVGGQEEMDIDDGLSDEYDPEEAPLQPVAGSASASASVVDAPSPGEVVSNGPSDVKMSDAPQPEIQQVQPPQEVEPRALRDPPNQPYQLYQPSQPTRSSQFRPRFNHSYHADSARPPLSNKDTNQTASFTPYESPLSSLKAFRYNQQLNEPTADGFRSLTYSDTIDLNVPLCPTELSGGECQNAACTEQHFRRFQLTDEQILVQMSKADDIEDQAVKDDFTHGLKALIGNLRARGVKEFEQVATELSTYRRDFFAKQRDAL